MPLADVMRIHSVPKRFAAYWAEKAADPAFHAGELGGARNVLLDNARQAAEQQLWQLVAGNPVQPMTDLAREMQNHGYPVDRR